MPRLTNPRHEVVARELAKGKTAAKAMRCAGYTGVSMASRMLRNVDIQARLDELTRQYAANCGITKESQTAALQLAYEDAMRLGQISAAVQAVKEQSQLHGLRVERQEVAPPGAFEALRTLNDKDYAAKIMERINAAMFAAVKPPSDTEQ
jgi:hypothetical protein